MPPIEETFYFKPENEAADAADLIRGRFSGCGVVVPDGTVAHVMALTAGNPNFVQKICQFVVGELEADRRAVVTNTDIERAGDKIVRDSPQFTTTWYNPSIVTEGERIAVNEIIDRIPAEGGWVSLREIPATTLSQHVFSLIKKLILVHDQANRRVRISGLLLERFLRSQRDMTPYVPTPGRPNVAVFVDYENTAPLFPPDLGPSAVADAIALYAEDLGNPVVRNVIANWQSILEATRIQAAFRQRGFVPIESLRTKDRADGPRRAGNDKNLADMVIQRVVYNRMLDERDSANDTIDYYVIVSGDSIYMEIIVDLVEKQRRRVRLLALKGDSYLSAEYAPYESICRRTAATPGLSPEIGFQVDDLAPYLDRVLRPGAQRE